ncbi:MAG: hypothetical protein IT514_04090 [Burkholderiales bacterium]|nr:hypothetical protein [Burkholderiales bacterium]
MSLRDSAGVACAETKVTPDEGVHVIAEMIRCTGDELRVVPAVAPCRMPLAKGMHLQMFQPDRVAS